MIAKLIPNGRVAVILSLLIAITFSPAVRAADSADQEREDCRKNMERIYQAIQSYRRENKDLPGYLSDLVGKHLKDPNALTCPTARRNGNVNTLGNEDPKISTTYIYEFSDQLIPKQVPSGEGHTMKEWKRRQMSWVGGAVPMLRCHNHGKVLNIGFDGVFYEGEGGWENAYSAVMDTSELYPKKIFAAEAAAIAAARSKASIPPRAANTSSNLIDLSRHYNAALSESWHPPGPGGAPANNLEWLPSGVQKFGGVEFDVRGLIQLRSKQMNAPRYPLNVNNIKVDQKAGKLHFLHSTGWSAPDGTPVCNYVVHYANGKTETFTVKYGDHVIDWVNQAAPQDTASIVAWSGRSPVNNSQTQLQIYKTVWTNPQPDQTITSIDFVAANQDPAPFLIAITAEQ
jgi:type II secretory pathway pseudopilin PulG